jgi:hypothetical protein
MHALLFMSMGVEARCCPSKSTAHFRHMKRQPFLCNGCRCRGRCHCHHCCHLCRCCRLHHHCHCRCPLPLRLPSTIAAALSVASPSAIAITVSVALTIGHCRLHYWWPLQLPSLLAITVTVAVGHFRELLPWCGKNRIWPIEAKNAHLILFCSDGGWCTDQSRITDQVSSGNGQHQRWAASSKQ